MAKPPIKFEQEVRFAVVLYGGVSLAIYINGVAQEMLAMARATGTTEDDEARWADEDGDDTQLGATGAVYRDLARYLGRDSVCEIEEKRLSEAPLRTRFVIDIISGTSAGGINGIFLAKALANDQELSRLKNLWLEKADIETLINDSHSWKQRDVTSKLKQSPPKSLLSSDRMLALLEAALGGMGEASGEPSPYVDEIDLFITTTDIEGLPIELKLSDKAVQERRHKHVFHFRYNRGKTDAKENDFLDVRNEFLAFAARSTSAFPFAFEPTSPGDMKGADDYARFFRAYGATDFKKRSFGDGGYLDNKPFSHAIDVIARRRSTLPIRRKLVYIEPAPERLGGAAGDDGGSAAKRPNALENTAAALSLARYETIREDLQVVMDRNRLIERLSNILIGLEEDTFAARLPGNPERGPDYVGARVSEYIRREGGAYGGYHRLKVAAMTDRLARLVARAADIDDRSDRYQAVRLLVREWRKRYFDPEGSCSWAEAKAGPAFRPGAAPGVPRETPYTETVLLFWFDLDFRIRRLNFVLRRLEALEPLRAARRTLRRLRVLRPTRRALEDAERLQQLMQARAAQAAAGSGGQDEGTEVRAEEGDPEAAGFAQHVQQVFDVSDESSDLRRALRAVVLGPADEDPADDDHAELRERVIELLATARDGDATSASVKELESMKAALEEGEQADPAAKELRDNLVSLVTEAQLRPALHKLAPPQGEQAAGDQEDAAFEQELRDLRKALYDVYAELLKQQRALERQGANMASGDLGELNEGLSQIMAAEGEKATQQAVENLLEAFDERLCELATKLQEKIGAATLAGYTAVRDLLPMKGREPDGDSDGLQDCRTIAIRAARHYHDYYANYDMLVYPALHTTEVGAEISPVDVFRISPVDATAASADPKRLAGTALMNFGAFLDRSWRWNDMLWGRLDGAERLIYAVWPPGEKTEIRDGLIRRAHQAIIKENLSGHAKRGLEEVAARELPAGATGAEALREQCAAAVEALQRESLANPVEALGFLRERYAVNPSPDSERSIRSLARSTVVTGKILDDLADEYGATKAPSAWLIRGGRLLWGLAEVAVPRELAGIAFRHWLQLGLAFSVLLIVGGAATDSPAVQRFGFTLLAIGGLFSVSARLVRNFMRGERSFTGLSRFLGILVLLGLTVTAFVVAWPTFVSWWARIGHWGRTGVTAAAVLVVAIFLIQLIRRKR